MKVLLIALVLAGSAATSIAADMPGCKVSDPELQARYSGDCQNGLAEGKGIAEGIARYEGDFKAGRKHGKGVKTWPTGDRYEGDFVAARREGQGTYTWGTGTPWAGEKYSGGYRNDLRDGRGTYTWPDGETYSGELRNDRLVGAPTKRMLARAQEERERLAAVSKPGLGVCRRMTVGSVVRDWIRGTIVRIDGSKATVRIDDAGQFEHRIQAVTLTQGTEIEDWALMWTPCLPAVKK